MPRTFSAVNGTTPMSNFSATLTPVSAALPIPDSLIRLREEARQRVARDREDAKAVAALQRDDQLKQLTEAIRSDLLHDLHPFVDWARAAGGFGLDTADVTVFIHLPGHHPIEIRFRRAAGNWHRWSFHVGSTVMGKWYVEAHRAYAHGLGEALALAQKTPEEIDAEQAFG